jgi:prevent-host-death family protein
MIEVSQSELRDNLARVLRAARRGDPVIVKRRGKPVVAIVPISDWELLNALEDRLDAQVIESRKNEPTIPWEQIKAESAK